MHDVLKIAIPFFLLISTGAFASTEEVSRRYEAAVRYFAEGEYVAAVIDLKNALQQQPDHVPSLVLKGEIFLDQGLADAAETDIRRALELGADRSRCLVLLAKAMLAQRKTGDLLKEIRGDRLGPDAGAAVHAYRAQAQIFASRFDLAAAELDAADRLSPGATLTQLVRIALFLHHEELDNASRLADRLIVEQPHQSDVWKAAGSVAHAQGRFEVALERYDRAIEINSRNGDARIARLSILIDQGRDEETAEDLGYFAQHHPTEPRASYLRALRLARGGDSTGARKALENTAYTLSNYHDDELFRGNSPLLLIAALTHYGLGHPEQTARYAESYLLLQPGHAGATRLLGDALLRANRPDKAVRELALALTYDPDDIALATLAATAYGRIGRYASAARVLERVSKLNADDSRLKTQYAAVQIGAGRVEQGIQTLSRLLEEDPTRGPTGLTLMITHLRRDDFSLAVEVGEKLHKHNPRDLSILNMLGVAFFLSGNYEQASAQFAACLEADPDFLPAAINIAKTDVVLGHLEVARARLNQLAAQYSENARIRLELSRLETAAGNPRAALAHAGEARRLASQDMDVLANLVNLHLAQGNLTDARALSRAASANPASSLEARELRTRVLIAEGDLEAARALLIKMADMAGQDAQWLVRTAAYQARIGYPRDAAYSLRTALAGDPGNLLAHLGLIEQLLAQDKADDALGAALAASRKFPAQAQVQLLLGEAHFATGDVTAALESFDRALELEPLIRAVVRGAHAEVAIGNRNRARGRLENWLLDHPQDDSVHRALADLELTAGDHQAASRIYETLVTRYPDNPQLLNNLAFTLHELDDDRAIGYARRAVSVAATDANANDTLGWILVGTGQPEEALGYLREASTREWNDPEIRYHLAACLADLGRSDEALREVRAALENTYDFAGQEAATALLLGLTRMGDET